MYLQITGKTIPPCKLHCKTISQCQPLSVVNCSIATAFITSTLSAPIISTGTIFLVPGTQGSDYNITTIAGDNVLGYYGESMNTGTLNITHWGTTGNEISLNANTVTITDTLNVTH